MDGLSAHGVRALAVGQVAEVGLVGNGRSLVAV